MLGRFETLWSKVAGEAPDCAELDFLADAGNLIRLDTSKGGAALHVGSQPCRSRPPLHGIAEEKSRVTTSISSRGKVRLFAGPRSFVGGWILPAPSRKLAAGVSFLIVGLGFGVKAAGPGSSRSPCVCIPRSCFRRAARGGHTFDGATDALGQGMCAEVPISTGL